MWSDTNSQVSPLKQILGLMQTFTRASYQTWIWIRYGSEWKHLFPERNDEPESHNTPDMNVDEP